MAGSGRFNFTSHELALMCASHSGEAMHIGIVQRMLAAAGVDESACQCGSMRRRFFAATRVNAPAVWSASPSLLP